jgi:hypothetical protein
MYEDLAMFNQYYSRNGVEFELRNFGNGNDGDNSILIIKQYYYLYCKVKIL